LKVWEGGKGVYLLPPLSYASKRIPDEEVPPFPLHPLFMNILIESKLKG